MQKHQNWLNNRNYQHHLNCLRKIRLTPRLKTINANNRFKKKTSVHQRSQHASNEKDRFSDFNDSQGSDVTHRVKSPPPLSANVKKNPQKSLTIRRKQLMVNNFELGKRIIETPPVISVKKHKEEYRKYKRLIEARRERSKWHKNTSDFRETKLKQFVKDEHFFHNVSSVPDASRHKFILLLGVEQLRGNRNCRGTKLDNFFIRMRMRKSNNKLTAAQNTKIVNVEELYSNYFHFGVNSKWIEWLSPSSKENFARSMHSLNCIEPSLNFQVHEVKGLETILFGCFSISLADIQSEEDRIQVSSSTDICRWGKVIGEIDAKVIITARKTFAESSIV